MSHSKTFERLVQLSELEEEVSHVWFYFIIENLKIALYFSNWLIGARILKKHECLQVLLLHKRLAEELELRTVLESALENSSGALTSFPRHLPISVSLNHWIG